MEVKSVTAELWPFGRKFGWIKSDSDFNILWQIWAHCWDSLWNSKGHKQLTLEQNLSFNITDFSVLSTLTIKTSVQSVDVGYSQHHLCKYWISAAVQLADLSTATDGHWSSKALWDNRTDYRPRWEWPYILLQRVMGRPELCPAFGSQGGRVRDQGAEFRKSGHKPTHTHTSLPGSQWFCVMYSPSPPMVCWRWCGGIWVGGPSGWLSSWYESL